MFTHHASVDTKLSRAVERLLDSATEDGILPIVQAGEPVLRQRTVAYDGQLTRATLTKLISLMHSTMLEAPGVGLAAPQIGLGLAIAVIEDHVRDDEDDPRDIAELPFRAIINPHYEPIGTQTRSFYEGCLSVSGYQAVSVGLMFRQLGKMKTANNIPSVCTAGLHVFSSMKLIIFAANFILIARKCVRFLQTKILKIIGQMKQFQ